MADAFADLRKGLFAQMQQNQMQAFQKQLQEIGGKKDEGQPQQIGQPQPQADVWPELTGGIAPAAQAAQAPEMQAYQLAQVQQQAQAMAQIPQAAAAASSGSQPQQFFDWAQVGALAGAQQKLKEEEDLERQKSHKYKMAMCEFWQSKRCRKGDNCTWAHGEHELRQPQYDDQAGSLFGIPAAGTSGASADKDSSTCWYYNRGWCTRGAQCKFVHDPSKQISHPKLGKETCGPSATTQQEADAVTLLYQQALMQQLQSDPNAYAAALAQAAAGSGGYDEATLAAIAQWQQALAAQAAAQQ